MGFPTPLSQEGRPMFWRESSNGISVAAFFSARALGTLVQRDGNGESFLPRKIYKNLVNNGITILTGTGFLSSTMAPEDECLCFLNNTTYVAICFFLQWQVKVKLRSCRAKNIFSHSFSL